MDAVFAYLSGGENTFMPEGDDPQMPGIVGQHSIGGIVKHLDALTAIGCSTVNSYRRLWDTGFWAPVFKDWGFQNRTTGLRISAPGRFEFRGATAPVVLRRLALASASLEAALREEPTRRAAQRFDHLPPEPPIGVSGTTTLTLLSASTLPQRRRYESDDVLEKVMGWLRAASERSVSVEDVALVHPRRELTPEDLKRTLQGLGLWPSATLKLRDDAPPPPPPPRPLNKPKPSDIFKKVRAARKRAEREERAAYRSAPAPA